MRIIDADDLVNDFLNVCRTEFEIKNKCMADENVLHLIHEAPTVCNDNYSQGYQDGVKKVLSERPHGEWINEISIDIGYKTAECSCCGERSRLISHDTGFGHKFEYYPFCHWCGADMRGESNELR